MVNLEPTTEAFNAYKKVTNDAVIELDKERHQAWLDFHARKISYEEYMAALDTAGRKYHDLCDKAWADCTKGVL